jgi:DNA-binding MarR family transcriptional regulator
MSPARRGGRSGPDPSGAEARRRLSEVLGALRRITGSPRLDRRVAVRSGVPIGFAAVGVLNKIIAEGPIRLGDLATAERMHPAALTRQVQALEAEGYIERRPDPLDGRASVVEVTSTGRAAARRVTAANDEIMAEQLTEWSTAELEELVAAMERLVVDLRSSPSERTRADEGGAA